MNSVTKPMRSTSEFPILARGKNLMRLWIATQDEAYLLAPRTEGGWKMTKLDGTEYWQHEEIDDQGELVIHCTCPGCEKHGPRCAGGKGCKHARMIRAIRQVVDPGE